MPAFLRVLVAITLCMGVSLPDASALAEIANTANATNQTNETNATTSANAANATDATTATTAADGADPASNKSTLVPVSGEKLITEEDISQDGMQSQEKLKFSIGAPAGAGSTIDPDAPTAGVLTATKFCSSTTSGAGRSYVVTVSYGADAGIPHGATLNVRELAGREYQFTRNRTENILEKLGTQVASVQAFDITILNTQGEEIQPKAPVDVKISIAGAPDRGEPSVVHFADTGTEVFKKDAGNAETKSATAAADKPLDVKSGSTSQTLSMTTESFSVYAVAFATATYYKDSEGRTWKISAEFGPKSGLPAGVELKVRELGAKEADGYLDSTAEALEIDPKGVKIAKAFDITFEKDGKQFHKLSDDVKISIELLDKKLDSSVEVVHFGKDSQNNEYAEKIESEVDGNTVTFSNDKFSVYVVAKEALLKHFVFLNGNNATNDIFSEQVLINGEKLVEPPKPTKPGAVFQYWTLDATADPIEQYDFANGEYKTVSINEETAEMAAVDPERPNETDHERKQRYLDEHPVYFYAVYDQMVDVIFYNQSGLVVQADKVPLGGTLNTADDQYGYTPIQDKENTYIDFQYWTTEKYATTNSKNAEAIKVHQDGSIHFYKLDDEGKPTTNANGVTSLPAGTTTVELFPVLLEGHHVVFDSNVDAAGGSASFVPALFVENIDRTESTDEERAKGLGEFVLQQINSDLGSSAIPTANGYDFLGWYVNPVAEEGVDDQVFENNNGTLQLHNNGEALMELGIDSNGRFQNNPTLYARWQAKDSANYTVIVWRQKITDDKNAPDVSSDEKTTPSKKFDFEASYSRSGRPGTSVTIDPADYPLKNANGQVDYTGFHLNTVKTETTATIKADGSTILNIYYDRDLITIDFIYRTFVNAGTNNPSPSTQYYSSDGVPLYRKTVTSIFSTEYQYFPFYCSDPNLTVLINDRTVLYNKSGNTYTEASKPYNNAQYYGKIHNQNDNTYRWGQVTYLNNQSYRVQIRDLHIASDRHQYYTGLYGQKISKYYEDGWPAGAWNNPINDSLFWSYVTTAISEFKSDFTTVTTNALSDTVTMRYYFQNTDGTENTDYSREPNDSAAFSKNLWTNSLGFNDLYDGMHPTKYKIGDADWVTIDPLNNARIQLTADTKVYFERDIEQLDFFDPTTGQSLKFTDSNNEEQPYKEVLFGEPMSLCRDIKPPKDENDPNDPHAGMDFIGWFYDIEGNTPINYDDSEETMPAANRRIYAKWEKKKYPVVVIPNGGELGGKTLSPNSYRTTFNVNHGEKISEYKDINRDYIYVGENQGTHSYAVTYDENGQKCALYLENNEGSTYGADVGTLTMDYKQQPGAYVLLGWYEAKQFEKDANGNDIRTQPKKDSNGNYLTDSRPFNFSNPPNRPVTLVAKWQRAGGFYVRYNIKDASLNLPDSAYNGIQIPVDDKEYVEYAKAIVKPSLGSPRGYALDYWTIENDSTNKHYQPNELLTITENLGVLQGSKMIITLDAHYKEYKPTERQMADYTFMTRVVEDNENYDPDDSSQGPEKILADDYTEYEKQRIAVNEELTPPITPEVADGYKFVGWYYDTAGIRRFDGFGVVAHPSYTTLYALYSKVHTVNYFMTNAQTGNVMEPPIVLATQTYSAEGDPEQLDTRHVEHVVDPDHYIVGWKKFNIVKNGDDTTYVPDSSSPIYDYNRVTSFAVNGNMNLYADVRERRYIKFDQNYEGGFVDRQELPGTSMKPVPPERPTRTGFTFMGWYTKKDSADLNCTQYDFKRDLTAANYPGYTDNTLYAHWRADGNTKGTMHVIFWAQTSDRPADDTAAAEDYSHYQMIYNLDLPNNDYGKYTVEALKQGMLSEFVADGQFSIVKTAQNAWNADNPAGKTFVEDALGYKGGNVNVTLTSGNGAGGYEFQNHISELTRYFEFNANKSDTAVNVDETDTDVLNLRFDLKTYNLEFNPNNKTDIHFGEMTYKADGTPSRYRAPIWLNRPIADLWPIITDSENQQFAYMDWKDPNNTFDSWQMRSYEWITEETGGTVGGQKELRTTLKNQNNTFRTAVNLADKLLIDSVIDNGTSNVLQVTLNTKPNSSLPKKAVVHYLIRDAYHDAFTERMDLRSIISVEAEPTNWGSNNNANNYFKFTQSNCNYHSPHQGTVYAYQPLEPVGMAGYVPLNNETAHGGKLLIEGSDNVYEPGWDANPPKNESPLYNLISNRKSMAQVLFSKNDNTYNKYFKDHDNQYVDGYYNIYFYYKPLPYKLSLYRDTTHSYVENLDVYCGEDLSDVIERQEITLTAPEGTTFGGWATAPYQDDASAAYPGTTMPSHNLTLYPIWQPITYTVTTVGANGTTAFECDGDEPVDPDNQNKEYTTTTGGAPITYGTQLRALGIPTPYLDEKHVFNGWQVKKPDGTKEDVTQYYTIRGDVKLYPKWSDLEARSVKYHQNFRDLDGTGNAPTDDNKYALGAKVIVADGHGLSVKRTDVDDHEYTAPFAYWNTKEDGSGQTYYPGNTFVFYEDSVDEENKPLKRLDLYAIYSQYRETKLTYNKNATDAVFMQADENWDASDDEYDSAKLKNGNLEVLYRDEIRKDFKKKADMIPNASFPMGQDGDGNHFTVERTDSLGNSYVFVGWATASNASLPIGHNGDWAYVNTIKNDQGVLLNTLYAIWGVCKVVDKDGEEHVFDTLKKAVDFIETTDLLSTAKTGTIQMLENYSMSATDAVSIPTGCNITLTTAKDGTLRYSGTGNAIITRAYNGTSMFSSEGTFTLTNIVLDGGNEQSSASSCTTDGGIVSVTAGTLNINAGATLRNSSTSGKGGAVFVDDGATVNLTAGNIQGNHVTEGSGGEGAGIYLQEGSALNISGAPSFSNNTKNDSLSGKTNGGSSYGHARQDIYIAGYAGKSGDNPIMAESLRVTGDLTSGDGSIWVWPEVTENEDNHYKQFLQFARFSLPDGVTLSDDQKASSMKAFRNAVPDDQTEASDVLYGEFSEEDESTDKVYIHWSGNSGFRKVILRKIDKSTYGSLAGAQFSVYKGSSTDPYVWKDRVDKTQTATLEGLTSQDGSGVFWVGELPYGTYYLQETVTPAGYVGGNWFTLTVGPDTDPGTGNGVVMAGPYEGDPRSQ